MIGGLRRLPNFGRYLRQQPNPKIKECCSALSIQEPGKPNFFNSDGRMLILSMDEFGCIGKKNRLGTMNTAWLSMTNEAMEALREQHRTTGNGKWVFVEPGTDHPYQYRLQWLYRLCKRSSVERFGFHGIRHLCASILAGKGVPLVDIQDHLRHDHLSTTEKYIHKIQKTRSVVNALTGLKGAFSEEGPQEAPKKAGTDLKTITK